MNIQTKVKVLNNTAMVLSYSAVALTATKRIKTAGLFAVVGQVLFVIADSKANDDFLAQIRAARVDVSNLANDLAFQHSA